MVVIVFPHMHQYIPTSLALRNSYFMCPSFHICSYLWLGFTVFFNFCTPVIDGKNCPYNGKVSIFHIYIEIWYVFNIYIYIKYSLYMWQFFQQPLSTTLSCHHGRHLEPGQYKIDRPLVFLLRSWGVSWVSCNFSQQNQSIEKNMDPLVVFWKIIFTRSINDGLYP